MKKKKKILNEIYERTINLEEKTLIIEIQLRKILQTEENRSKNVEIPKFLADLY
jgi:hypothetical protein